MSPFPIKTAILTISTRASAGEREDISGKVIRNIVTASGWQLVGHEIVPDDRQIIMQYLLSAIDSSNADLVLTTGGTGLSPSDVTPEATLAVIERRLPGFEEAMRMTGFRKTPYAILSRAVAGSRAATLIINLPGSPKGVQESLETLLPVIPHAVKVLQSRQVDDAEHDYEDKS
jgi:molybdenum cofactor synthesis domain-containing protein